MSNRTILELNHDLWRRIAENPEAFGKEVANYLRTASHEGSAQLRSYGARTLATIHHTDSVSISFRHEP